MPPSKNTDLENDTTHDDLSRWEQDGGPEASISGTSTLQVRSRAGSADLEDSHHPEGPIPVWLRESSKSFHWKWVPYPLRHFARRVAEWTKGPGPPQMQKINPLFPSIQEAPVRLIARYFPKPVHKAALLAFFLFCWLLIFSLVLHHSASAGNIKDYGKPQPIWCGASYWSGGNRCGLNGNRCRPFDNANLAFRCPANCKAVHVLTPHAVGTQEINYKPFVIGGAPPSSSDDNPDDNTTTTRTPSSTPIYRADSFLCQAAIHAGIISNSHGGCGVVTLTGTHTNFPSTTRNGIKSIPFDAPFPKSFTFLPNISSTCIPDLRWPLLAITVVSTTLLSLCTSTIAVFFPTVFTLLFFHVGLVSDPPTASDYASLSSLIIGRFLPAAFVAAAFYRYTVKPQQGNLHSAYIERTILWLGGAWIGSLNNYTFDFIPIQRLTPSDLAAQPGARLALVIIVVLLLAIALGQIWYLRLEGRLPKYLAIYALFVTFLLVCVVLPPLNLRIHHYFLALLLLPGTRLQTRPSLLYQGILVGLFVNGTARWGFDSILQTTAVLRGDGPLNTLLPNVTALAVSSANITFGWAHRGWVDGFKEGYDGVSVLVNDVERHRWYVGEGEPEKTFFRAEDAGKEYFRFGYMRGAGAMDFTRAGVWESTGEWREGEKGPSR
ncbi:MAG: hypothetical protein L6R40_003805 [Gallowayella cf. fulva]|nr:MAG: hypothetical protein L6R40_003805 [Xanthomendoza cf. fulva]